MPYQDETIPVYLFVGFLESGKTKFIQETLEDRRFNSGEKTLLLICEEGIEEYEPEKFAVKNVDIRIIEDSENLTEKYLSSIMRETGAKRVMIEYNGMWTVSELFQNMPDGWMIYQAMCFVDSQTFMQYNSNMRSLVVDKFNVAELVVFNRFEKSMDVQEYHKLVRGVSRRAEICYEYTDGEVAYDDIEDPLPFDVEAEHIIIADSDYALWYRDIMDTPEKYDGKTVTFKALIARNMKFPKNTFAVGRHIMTCCVEDIQYCWVVAELAQDFTPRKKHWVMVTADINIKRHKLYKWAGPVLTVSDIQDCAPPEKEVATFY